MPCTAVPSPFSIPFELLLRLLGAVALAVAVASAFAVAVAVTDTFRMFKLYVYIYIYIYIYILVFWLAGVSFLPRKHNLIFFSALVTTSLIEFSDQSDGTAWLNWLEIIFRHGKPVL